MSKKNVSKDTSFDKATLKELYKSMMKIRQFEDKAYELFSQNMIPGTIHIYAGEEAVATGVCSSLKSNDYITSTHRGHGHGIAKGCDLKLMMAELFGRKTGYCKGKGGSMHVCDFKSGMLGAMGVVGSGIPVAVGAALSSELLGEGRVVACFFGDGAVNLGTFHESINLAALWNLPVIFVCENNLYAMSTSVARALPIDSIAERASAYGISGAVSNGMDVIDVYKAAKEAVDNARSGKGPTLLEFRTYRWRGHARLEPATYRPKEEVETWKKRDPIENFKRRDLLDKAELKEIEEEVRSEIDEAIKFATDSSWPDPEEALDDVYV